MTKRTYMLSWTALVLVAALAAAAAGCGKDENKTTGPPPVTKELNSATLSQNQVYEHTFATIGTFTYHCTVHSFMHGTVVVDDATAAGDKTVDIQGNAYSPASVTVHSGNKVTWTNKDVAAHTVTSD
jgi:plastocyanin